MKLMPSYSVAIYSAQTCTFFDSPESVNLSCGELMNEGPTPDIDQLDSIQATLSLDNESIASRLIVLVPDSWLSVSQHQIDHLIPSSLLPLAALSYAVETTYSPPELVMFSYQQEVLPIKRTQLTVFACSNQWAERLCLPFKHLTKSCLIMTKQQWVDMPSKVQSWSFCSQRALSVYQPDKEKRKSARRLWGYLLMLSVIINSTAFAYLFVSQQRTERALLERKVLLETQSTWSSQQETSEFSESVLGLVQTLPVSARLAQFDGRIAMASFKVTLPKQDLDRLLESWHQQHQHWRWKVEAQSLYLPASVNQEEMVDASISVFEH